MISSSIAFVVADAYDVAGNSPLQGAGLRNPTMPRAMHEEGEKTKRSKNNVEARLSEQGKDFVPFVASTYGVWSNTARSTFSTWANQLALLRGKDSKRVLNKDYHASPSASCAGTRE